MKRNLELLQSSKASGCGRWPSQGALYKRWNLRKLTAHRVQRRNVKQNEFRPIPKGAFNLQIHVASIKVPLNTPSVFRSDPRHPQRKSIDNGAPRTPKCQERAMSSRGNFGTHKETRLSQSWRRPENVKILLPVRGSRQHDFEGLLWGQKVLQASAHSVPNPRLTPRRKKCPRTVEGNPYCQNELQRTTLSSADQNHRIGRCHVAQDNPLEDHKRDSKPYGLAVGAW